MGSVVTVQECWSGVNGSSEAMSGPYQGRFTAARRFTVTWSDMTATAPDIYTAAGIPARILDEAKKTQGFNAYGIGNDQNDPLSKAIHGLLGHSMAVDQRINLILEQLERMGVNIEEERATADKFDPNYLNKIVD